jgi:Tfp pilus assembly protein PilN
MFTIDLLKGQGIPKKTKPGGIVIAAVTVAIPTAVAIAMLGFYLFNGIITSIKRQEIVRWEAKISRLSEAIKLQESLEKEKIIYSNCLSEVMSAIGRYTQWSPVLMTFVENMPDSVVLTTLEVKQRSIKRKVPKKDDPERMIDIDVPVRVLQASVCGSRQHNCDKAVRDFRDRLCSSDFLGPKLEDIIVSQESGTFEGQEVVSYEIDCVFKPGL